MNIRRAVVILGAMLSLAHADAQSLGNAELQQDTLSTIKLYAMGIAPGCKVKVSRIEVKEPTKNPKYDSAGVLVRGEWKETWTVTACKKKIVFDVKYKANPKGGTDLLVTKK